MPLFSISRSTNTNYATTPFIRQITPVAMRALSGHEKNVQNYLQVTEQIYIKQLLDEVEHDIMNYQNRGLCYLPKPKAEADNTDTRF